MSNPPSLGRILRSIGIVLLGLTAVFHLLGGIGTTCVALGLTDVESMAGITPFIWLYQVFIVGTILIAVLGIRATIRFARVRAGSYRFAIIILLGSGIVTTIHIITSRVLRGASMPNDARLYMTILTLIVFLLFRIPRFMHALEMDKMSDSSTHSPGMGATAIIMGIATLTVQIWDGPTHTFNEVNFADVWHVPLSVVGWGLILIGIALITRSLVYVQISSRQNQTVPGTS